jgi:hypothetical protein
MVLPPRRTARPSFFIESLQRLAQTQGTQVPVLSWKQSLREVKNKNRETEVIFWLPFFRVALRPFTSFSLRPPLVRPKVFFAGKFCSINKKHYLFA